MSATIRKAAKEQRCELYYASGRVFTDTLVDSIEFSSGGLTSAIRQLPAWEDTITIGFKIAFSYTVNPGSLGSCQWFFGLCSGPTRKYGQAGEYCIGNGTGTKARTQTQRTFAGVVPTAYTHDFVNEKICLWNAGASTVVGGGATWSFPNCQAVWPAGSPDNAAYGSKTWSSVVMNFRRSAANTIYVRWSQQFYPNVCVSRDEFREGVTDFSSDLTSTAFDSRQPWCVLHARVFAATDIMTVQGSVAVDEATYGSFDYFNVAWDQATGSMFLRDIWVSAKYPQFYP